jgi:hypothetical protein
MAPRSSIAPLALAWLSASSHGSAKHRSALIEAGTKVRCLNPDVIEHLLVLFGRCGFLLVVACKSRGIVGELLVIGGAAADATEPRPSVASPTSRHISSPTQS